MSEVSPDVRESARKIEQVIRNALAEMGQVRLADKVNTSESTISRWKDSGIDNLALLLAGLRLQVVSADANLIDGHEVKAMSVLALARVQDLVERNS